MLKYELTGEKLDYNGQTLYQIRALRKLKNRKGVVVPGTIGGYIANQNCLSQDDNSWVFPDAIVLEGSSVIEDAVLAGHSIIDECTELKGHALLVNTELYDSHLQGYFTIIDNIEVPAEIPKFAWLNNLWHRTLWNKKNVAMLTLIVLSLLIFHVTGDWLIWRIFNWALFIITTLITIVVVRLSLIKMLFDRAFYNYFAAVLAALIVFTATGLLYGWFELLIA